MGQYKVFILRHADMFRKAPRNLNPRGIEQAHRVGREIAQLGYRHIILASPYERTMQTANIIAEHVNTLSVDPFNSLHEYERGESLEVMSARAKTALQFVLTLFKLNPIIVSHREPIRAMMAGILNRPQRKISVPKAGGFVLDFDDLSSQYNNVEACKWT